MAADETSRRGGARDAARGGRAGDVSGSAATNAGDDLGNAAANAPLVLDLVGLNCPLPVLRTRRALADLAPGARVVVHASDPLAAIDLPHLCTEDGHRLVSLTREEGGIAVEIERGDRPPPEA